MYCLVTRCHFYISLAVALMITKLSLEYSLNMITDLNEQIFGSGTVSTSLLAELYNLNVITLSFEPLLLNFFVLHS